MVHHPRERIREEDTACCAPLLTLLHVSMGVGNDKTLTANALQPSGLHLATSLSQCAQVAGFVASTAIFAHSEKNTSTCVQGYIAIEGVYCLVQFPLSCALVAFARERARRAAAK